MTHGMTSKPKRKGGGWKSVEVTRQDDRGLSKLKKRDAVLGIEPRKLPHHTTRDCGWENPHKLEER